MYSKYPFLRGARTLGTQTTELKYKETTLSYFNRMLLGPIHNELQTERIQVHLFLNSIILLKKINSNIVSRKFISDFAKVFESYFLRDMPNKDIRDEVLDFFNISSEYQRYSHDVVSMSVPYYLAFVRDMRGAEFRLVNQAVNNGTVTISNKQFVLILRTLLEGILLKRIQDMKSVDMVTGIDDSWVDEIRERYRKHESHSVIHTEPGTTMPPCILHIIGKIEKEHHLTHTERLFLSTYMFSKQYDEEWLVENVFQKLSDWNERVTRYQLKSVRKLMVMGCEKVESNGLCRKQEDKLNKCSHIKNPYLYS